MTDSEIISQLTRPSDIESDGTSDSSQYLDSTGSNASSDDFSEDMGTPFGSEPWQNEPTRIRPSEEPSSVETSSEEEELDIADQPISRVGNIDWCHCDGNCMPMGTAIESVCCKEVFSIKEDMFEGIVVCTKPICSYLLIFVFI